MGTRSRIIDAAWPKDYPVVVDSLRQIGAGPGQVGAVVLTHAHPDHVGVAERLRAEHAAVVRTHVDEVGHATGKYPSRPPGMRAATVPSTFPTAESSSPVMPSSIETSSRIAPALD